MKSKTIEDDELDFLTKKFGLYFGQLIFSQIYKPKTQTKAQNQFGINRQPPVYNQTDNLVVDNSNVINARNCQSQAVNRTEIDTFATNNHVNEANISKSSSDHSEDWFFN